MGVCVSGNWLCRRMHIANAGGWTERGRPSAVEIVQITGSPSVPSERMAHRTNGRIFKARYDRDEQ